MCVVMISLLNPGFPVRPDPCYRGWDPRCQIPHIYQLISGYPDIYDGIEKKRKCGDVEMWSKLGELLGDLGDVES